MAASLWRKDCTLIAAAAHTCLRCAVWLCSAAAAARACGSHPALQSLRAQPAHLSAHPKLDARRSLLLDKFEFLQPENAYDAFSFFHRVVLSPIAHHFGASFADLLNVAGFTCVSALGGIEYIPEVCDAQEVPLKVRAHAVCVRALAAHSRAVRCL